VDIMTENEVERCAEESADIIESHFLSIV